MIKQTKQQTKYCLGLASQSSKKVSGNIYIYKQNEEDVAVEKLRKDIEVNQHNALSLCTKKVLLACQAYELIDSHIKRLDEDLNNFVEDLKHEGKVQSDELAILPPLPMIVTKAEKHKSSYGTPQSKRSDIRDRTYNVELSIAPNEPTYCICHQCQQGEWFHYSCVGLTPETRFKGKWYCPTCRLLPQCQ